MDQLNSDTEQSEKGDQKEKEKGDNVEFQRLDEENKVSATPEDAADILERLWDKAPEMGDHVYWKQVSD